MISAHSDEHWMRLALREARKGVGRVAPNPLVGAVIVKENKCVGRGFHKKRGSEHAEVLAIASAGTLAAGATIYVSLEPCCHYGQTPPCTKAIIEAGIYRVVYAQTDPNPKVKACDTRKILKEAGIEVVAGVLEKAATDLNRYFNASIISGLPYITLKLGMTLNGMIADRYGSSKWITNEHSRKYVQTLRRGHDAVLVGIGTVLADDPELTVRNAVRDNTRIIVDPDLKIPLESRLLKAAGQVVVITQKMYEAVDKARELRHRGAIVLGVESKKGRFDVKTMLHEISALGVWSILVEGGGAIAHSFNEANVINRYELFYAPKVMADLSARHGFSSEDAQALANLGTLDLLSIKRFGDDVLHVYEPKKLG